MAFFALCLVLFFYVSYGSCPSYLQSCAPSSGLFKPSRLFSCEPTLIPRPSASCPVLRTHDRPLPPLADHKSHMDGFMILQGWDSCP